MTEFEDNRFSRRLRKFPSSREGSIGMMFGLLAVPLMGMVGMAVDFSRVVTARYQMQDAVDAAILAGGRAAQTTLSDPAGAASAAARIYLEQAMPSGVEIADVDVSNNSSSTELTLSVTYWVPTPIVSVFHFINPQPSDSDAPAACRRSALSCQRLATEATAVLSSGGGGGSNIEVAMMLDVTGSMLSSDGKGSTRLESMKKAAVDAVDILIWSDQSRNTARMSLIPFAASVNAGTYASAVTGLAERSGRNRLISCVVERLGPNAYTDAPPSQANGWIGSNAATNAMAGFSYDSRLGSSNYNSSGNCSSSSPSASEAVIPLTNDKNILKTSINALTANGTTAGHIGTAWAWYTLSPEWASIWPESSRPASYGELSQVNSKGYPVLQKYAVLMTDGDYNVDYSTTTSFNQARSLCTSMKAKGITVFTVGFMVSNTARTFLTQCANGPDYFYNATDGDKLKEAFRDIALKISTLRLAM